MTNELTVMSDWQAMKEQANVLMQSGFLPSTIKTPAQALAIALTGKELGIGFMESVRGINVIAGRPTITPQLMLARAYKTKELESISIDSTDERSIVVVKRKGSIPHTYEFGVKEAQALGLMAKDNYIKQRKIMFQWRAIAGNLRVTFPDATSGMLTPEELDATVVVGANDSMEVIETEETTREISEQIERKEPAKKYAPPVTPQQVIAASVGAVVHKEPSAVDPITMVTEITDWLGLMNNGDKEQMDQQLKGLTSYKSKKQGEEGKEKWLKVSDLPVIATKLPNWLKTIHEKVSNLYSEWSAQR